MGDQVKALIVQPFYLPWIGYYGMMDKADIFIIADDVQFVKKSWHRRNKIKMLNMPKWLTVPVIKSKDFQMINEVVIDNTPKFKEKHGLLNWKEKHWKLISLAYAKAPYFDEYRMDIEEIYTKDWNTLSELDIFITEKIFKLMNLKIPEIVKLSNLGLKGKKVDLILNVCNEVGADEYISGPAARNYIDYNEYQKFKQENIDLYWFEFSHPVYPQLGNDFLPFLSAIDLLFNTGKKSRDYIRQSNENCLQIEGGDSLK